MKLTCEVLVGGVSMVQQSIALAKRPHAIVATSGRLLDHLSNTKGFSLCKLKYLIFDKADKLLDLEFEESVDKILDAIPRQRKTYLFSATLTRKVKKLQRACLRNPAKIDASSKYSLVENLKQGFCLVSYRHKDCFLVYMLSPMPEATSMIFTKKCQSTKFLAFVLRSIGLRAVPINGHMSQSNRLGALNKFKSGECNILVCTDVASRGLDIPSVDMVVIYDIPRNAKDYIHRVGRIARAGRSGYAISLVNDFEAGLFSQIEEQIGQNIDKVNPNQGGGLAIFRPCYRSQKN